MIVVMGLDSHLRLLAVIAVLWCATVAGQEQGERVPLYVEYSPAAQELADRATRLRHQDRPNEAAEVYQQIIEQYGRKLMSLDGGVHVDAAVWASQEIASDDRLLAAYRTLYETSATHALNQASAPDVDVRTLEAVMVRYPLCDAAMEAGLHLAAVYLERGHFSLAESVLDGLDGHPDLSTQSSRWNKLQAAAGLFGGKPDLYRSYAGTLDPDNDRLAIEELAGWSKNLDRPESVVVLDSSRMLPVVDLPESLRSPLWSRMTHGVDPIPVPAMRRVLERPYPFAASMPMNPTLPVVVGNVLYLNEGIKITCLDHGSGRQIWSYPQHNDVPSPIEGARRIRTVVSEQQLRSVAIRDQRLVGVLNRFGPETRQRIRGFNGGETLICLDRTDGSVLWQVEPSHLDPTLSNTAFEGTTIGQAGQVYVLLRRSQPSGFQDVYLAAVDLSDGDLIWHRHLTSASTTLAGLRQITLTLGQQGVLYAADNLGAVAAINKRNGVIRWLTLLEDRPDTQRVTKAQAHTKLSIRQPSPPVLADAGLVVGPLVGLSDCYVLDLNDGRLKQRLKGESWKDTSYLIGVAGDVLVVGPKIWLMDGRTLEPRWSQPLGHAPSAVPHGRAAVTEDRVVVPTRDQVIVLDRIDGTILAKHQVEETGHILALPNELIIAGASTIRGYLSWTHAYDRLRQQIADNPRDPNPGLALAQVALATDEEDAVLEGIDHALDAYKNRAADRANAEGADSAYPHFFRDLLGFVEATHTPRVSLRQKIFDRLATATIRAEDEAAYQLTLAAFLVETGQPNEAVDHYQAVLADPDLSGQPYRHRGGSSQAGFEAKWRLKKLIKQFGPGIYARHEALAAQRLAELTYDRSAEPNSLIELARIYPLSRAAPKALFAAADGLARVHDDSAAISLLRRAYGQASDPVVLQKVVGRLIELYEKIHRPSQAAQWLKRAGRDHPTLRPLRAGQPVTVKHWLEELTDQFDISFALPKLSLPLQEPFEVQGRLLTPTHQSQAYWPRDFVIVQNDNEIQLRTGERLEVRWRFRVPTPRVELLALTEDQILLWDPLSGSLSALDAQTGEVIWRRLNVIDHLQSGLIPNGQEQVPGQAQRVWRNLDRPNDERILIQRIAERRNDQIMLAINDMVICAADNDGGVIGLDRYTGELMWRADCPLKKIQLIDLNESVLAVAGQRSDPSSKRQGTLMLIDAFTGDPRFALHDDPQQIRWLQHCREDLLAYCSSDRIVMYDLNEGDVAWWTTLQGQHFTGQGQSSDGLLMLLLWDIHGTILALDNPSGRVVNRIGLPLSRKRHAKIDFQQSAGDWHVLTSSQALALNAESEVRWSDAIDEDRLKNLELQLVGDEYVVLVDRDLDPRQVPRARQRGLRALQLERGEKNRKRNAEVNHTVYLLDRRGGGIVGQWPLDPLNAPLDLQRAVLLDNRIVLSTNSSLIVVPGSRQDP